MGPCPWWDLLSKGEPPPQLDLLQVIAQVRPQTPLLAIRGLGLIPQEMAEVCPLAAQEDQVL